MKSDLTKRIQAALADTHLRGVLRSASSYFQSKYLDNYAPLPDLETRKQRAQAARRRGIENAAALLPELAEKVAGHGGHVHWAEDGAAAVSIILEIAREHGVRSAVKGKSMLSEEIGLNKALEAAGIEPVETDLGEYIVQLADEPPSHIIAPAIHKTQEDVAQLFQQCFGKRGEAPEELTRIARDVLREKFLAAEMGVTGANLAVAETGSVLLVENEGNIRFSTTCPRVHVAVISVEKILPTWDDAVDVLGILSPAATGAPMPVYVSVFNGPRRDDEADGAEIFHLVILDNGRSEILADPVLREALRCIRCGACLNFCPVYGTMGGHAYATAHTGPIGTILSPFVQPSRNSRDLAEACAQCGSCAKVCPVGIDHPKLIRRLRERFRAEHPSLLQSAYARSLETPALYRAGAGVARALDPTLALAARVEPALSRFRPGLALEKPFRARWQRLRNDLTKERTQ